MKKDPKILIWDIEIAGVAGLGADFGYMVCFGYKWLGESKIHVKTVLDFPEFQKNAHDDSALVKFAANIMNEADLLVAHYGDKFDRRYLQTRMLKYDLPPIPPVKQIDTWRIAKGKLKLSSNRLDAIAKFLGLALKSEKDWPGWWLGALNGKRKAIKDMAKYCAQDVRVLENVYLKLRPLHTQHPHVNHGDCHSCGSTHIQSRGFHATRSGKKQRYQCQDCGHWMLDQHTQTVNRMR